MRTKFLAVRTANREDNVSVAFILSFLFGFLFWLLIFDFGFMLIFMEILTFVSSYLVFGSDRIASGRFLLYQLRNSKQTVNHKDTFYHGEEFFKVSALKGALHDEDAVITESDY